MNVFSADEVLSEEAFAIHGQAKCSSFKKLNEVRDNRSRKIDFKERKKTSEHYRSALYRELNSLDRTALCLSGGGIRSAAFSLGVVQALASHPRASKAGSGHIKGKSRAEHASASLLAQFHYLSTVSGGGYLGSFLSAWRYRTAFPKIWGALVGRPKSPDEEAQPLAWLRAYSNYLTPKVGLMSADTWAGAAITGRNLVLNWLVILPVLCVVLLVVKLLSVASVGLALVPADKTSWAAALSAAAVALGVLSLGYAPTFATRHRPTWQPRPAPAQGAPPTRATTTSNVDQKRILWNYLAPSVGAAMMLTQFTASNHGLGVVGPLALPHLLAYGGGAGFLVYAASWLLARLRAKGLDARQGKDAAGPKDLVFWSFAGTVHGAMASLCIASFALAPWDGPWLFNDLLLPLIFGVPMFLALQTLAEMIFTGLSSYEDNSDSDREWFGRSAGWMLAMLASWIVFVFLAFAGSYVVEDLNRKLPVLLASVGGTTGLVTALVGGSSLSPVAGRKGGAWPITTTTMLAIAAPLFAAVLIVFLSCAIDALLLDGRSLVRELRLPGRAIGEPGWNALAGPLTVGLVIALALSAIASRAININRFSLHAVYRNRLIRAFLGASNPTRRQDAFTGFDIADNPCMHELWSNPDSADWRPFHVVNIALNIVSTHKLAWQQRKAESFTVSPLHAGSHCKAYRESCEYGYPTEGITLGTAMAISGAAASPNMGYNSSPAVTFLLALFNVRLGWWLGNPGEEGEATYRDAGPRTAIAPFLKEVFGLTTDEQPYVYLSDGGHFENLGLYEMVRRRCRSIVLVDAGADPNFVFEDVGNAVRKIALDLGVEVQFFGLETLATRGAGGPVLKNTPYHALARIRYAAADGGGEDGVLLYIKPACHGTESAGVRSYAALNPAFPHQGTIDQFFSEPQFESYRALGFEIADGLLRKALDTYTGLGEPRLADILGELLSATERSVRQPSLVMAGSGAGPF